MKILGITDEGGSENGRIVSMTLDELEMLTSWSRWSGKLYTEWTNAVAAGAVLELRPIYKRAQAMKTACDALDAAAENLNIIRSEDEP